MIVLLGDPQQLDQPTQGSHPPGAEKQRAVAPARGSRLPASGPAHDQTRGGTVPRADLAPPPRRLRVHVGRLLRGPPAVGRGARAAARGRRCRWAGTRRGDRRRHGPALPPGGPRGQHDRLRRGGAGDRRDRLGPRRRRDAVDRPARRRAPGHRGRHRHRRPLQRARRRHRAGVRGRRPAAGLRRDRGQVPGPGGADQHLCDSARRRPRMRRAGWSSSTPSTG